MCLSLFACGGEGGGQNSAEKKILGAWNMEGKFDVFVFSDDGKVTRGNEQYDWWYDKDAGRYCLSFYGMTYTFVIEEDDNGRYFSVEDTRLYHVENYDPEKMKAEYIAEQRVSLVEGKTEMVIGSTYTTASGSEFTFVKAELTGEEDAVFNLYITSEETLKFNDEEYIHFDGYSGFGIGWQPEGSEGNTHRYAGCCFKEISAVKAHKDTYGFLFFTIEDVEYYVPIETFVK